jgi:hypothetical protein
MTRVHGICRQCSGRTFISEPARICDRCHRSNMQAIVRGVVRSFSAGLVDVSGLVLRGDWNVR